VASPKPSHPGDHKLLSRAVADWLVAKIILGEVVPGERLAETKLAELAGVSRSPVREALRILSQEGLVELVPRIGAQVASIGATDASELYACRLLIEPRCVYEAVEVLGRSDRDELETIRAAMERAVAAEDARLFLSENVNYFRALAARCPNTTLRELVELTWNKATRYWSVLGHFPSYGEASLAHHVPLHEAAMAGDAVAAEAADRVILERALRVILAGFERGAEGLQAAAVAGDGDGRV
jgi:DNA-binding GntR family transcriptional regulator